MTLQDKIKNKLVLLRAARREFMTQGDMRRFDFALSTWFGSGLLIPAPGTWGTVGGLLFGLAVHCVSPALVPILAGILYGVGLWSIGQLEQRVTQHDSSFIVIDEVVAILLVLALLPMYNAPYIAAGFIIFRILDAVKPFPISWCDRTIAGALGVMVDDIVAALFTIIILWGFYLV